MRQRKMKQRKSKQSKSLAKILTLGIAAAAVVSSMSVPGGLLAPETVYADDNTGTAESGDQGTAPQAVRALAAVFTACATCGLFTDMKMFSGLFGSGPTPCQAPLSETSPSKIIWTPSIVYRIISGD